MKTRNIEALIEGGLSRTSGFKTTPEKGSLKANVKWLEQQLAAAQIPLLNTKFVMSFSPNTIIIEAGCCIATFRERCHNAGLPFAHIKPLNGDNNSCWLDVELDMQNEDYMLAGKIAMSGQGIYFVGMRDGKHFETSPSHKKAKVFSRYEDAWHALKQAAIAQGRSEKDLEDCWIKHWEVVPVRRN
jgi:hypothetical protein